MSRRRLWSLCGALLLVVAALVAWQTVAARRSAAAAAAARAAQAELVARLGQLRADRAHPPPRPPPSAARAPRKDADPAEALAGRRRVLYAWMALRFSHLYRKAGFTPDQIRQFEALLEDHFLRHLDLISTARNQGIPTSDPAIVQLANEENSRFTAALAGALGGPLAAAFAEDQRTAAARGLADAVAGSTYFTQPMAADQADQLTQILANASASYAQGHAAKADDLNIEAALAQAQAVLSPAQLEALKNLYYGNQSLQAYFTALAAATPARAH